MSLKTLVAGALAAALAVCGCGASHAKRDPKRLGQPHVLIAADKTGATAVDPEYKNEITALIERLAKEHADVDAVALDGQPLTTGAVESRNFAEPPPEGVEDTEALEEAVGSGFAHNFLEHAAEPENVHGSGQLQGLKLAAGLHVSEVDMWTDGIVNEADFDLTRASSAEVQSEIARWKPQLRQLAGKTVVLIGVGRGVHEVATVERAHELFTALVTGDGGHLVWAHTLSTR